MNQTDAKQALLQSGMNPELVERCFVVGVDLAELYEAVHCGLGVVPIAERLIGVVVRAVPLAVDQAETVTTPEAVEATVPEPPVEVSSEVAPEEITEDEDV